MHAHKYTVIIVVHQEVEDEHMLLNKTMIDTQAETSFNSEEYGTEVKAVSVVREIFDSGIWVADVMR